MENTHGKTIKDIYCPLCGESLLFPNAKWPPKIGGVVKSHIFLVNMDRVLFFKIIRSNNQEGFLELSIIPGDYTKYVSLNLLAEEEVTFIHPHCHKAMNEKGWVKILVQHEGETTVQECFINARYGIEVTLCQDKDGKIGAYYGKEFKSLADYFKREMKKISARK
jgi:hypothetical protein